METTYKMYGEVGPFDLSSLGSSRPYPLDQRSMPVVMLSHEESQQIVFRGCARLKRALQVKFNSKDAERKWQEKIVEEAVRPSCYPSPSASIFSLCIMRLIG